MESQRTLEQVLTDAECGAVLAFVRGHQLRLAIDEPIDLLDACDRAARYDWAAHYDWRPVADLWAASMATDPGAIEALCRNVIAVVATGRMPARWTEGEHRPAEVVRRDLRRRRTCSRVWEGEWCDDAPVMTFGEEEAHRQQQAKERADRLRREQQRQYAEDDRAEARDRQRAWKALDNACARIGQVGKGGRNGELNRSAYTLGGYVAVGLLDEEAVVEALTAAGVAAGLSHRDARHPVVFGMAKGKLRPMDLRR